MIRFAVTIVYLLLLVSCSSSVDRAQIQTLLDSRVQALSSKNLPQYLSLISSSYNDRGLDRIGKEKEIAVVFRTFDHINARFSNPVIKIDGATATATSDYLLKVTIKGKPTILSGRETLKLRREGSRWMIVGGL